MFKIDKIVALSKDRKSINNFHHLLHTPNNAQILFLYRPLQ